MECDNNKVEVGVCMHYYINEMGHSTTLTASNYIREACELRNVPKSGKSPKGVVIIAGNQKVHNSKCGLFDKRGGGGEAIFSVISQM